MTGQIQHSNPELNDLVKLLAECGKGTRVSARLLGVGPSLVQYYRGRNGIKREAPKPDLAGLSPELVRRCKEYRESMT